MASTASGIAAAIGGPVVIKSQVLTGGRMKAGGVQFAASPDEAVCIDLEALEARSEPEARTLNRYLSLIQTQRGDFNGKVLTIRRDDVRLLAAILDQSPGGLIERLDDLGLRRPSFG